MTFPTPNVFTDSYLRTDGQSIVPAMHAALTTPRTARAVEMQHHNPYTGSTGWPSMVSKQEPAEDSLAMGSMSSK